MNSKQNNPGVTPKRKTPIKRKSPSGKENNEMFTTKVSGKKVEQLMNDMRVSACKTISNFKCSLGDLSNRFRQSTIRPRRFSAFQQYKELNEQTTPVKLYSPFTFVTPSPPKRNSKRLSPKRCSFKSPSGTFKKDVQQLSKEVKELEKVEKSLCLRRRLR